jgi:GR25 family glycosyltransferase involved in LPS biosynthesis
MKISNYYVMNLKDREDRRQECIKEFKQANIENYEFVDSVHWKSLEQSYLDYYTNREYRHVTKKQTSKYGLLGCGISHLKCYEKFLSDYGDDKTKYAVILEDDFEITIPNEIEQFIDDTINKTSDWNFIYLGGLKNPKNDKIESYLPGLDIVTSVWNAHAYIVKNDKDFYDYLKSLFERGYFADRALRMAARENKHQKHKYLITNPYVIVQRKSFSNIENRIK